jgi:hypothetical protein
VLAVTLADLYGVHAFIYHYPDARQAFHPETREEIIAIKARGYDSNRDRVFPATPEDLYTYPLLNILAGVSVINDYSPLWLKRYRTFAEFYPNGVLQPDRATDHDMLSVTSARYVITATPYYRDLFNRAPRSVNAADAARDRTPFPLNWTVDRATPEAGGFKFTAATPADVSLVQARIPARPDTGYLIRFEASAESPLNRPLRVDLYGGRSYDSAAQEHTVESLPSSFESQSIVIDSGANPPAVVYVRVFTQSTVPIHLRAFAVTEVPLSTEPPYQEITATADGTVVFENKAALPRFRFAQELVPVRDVGEAHRLFQSPEFNKATTVTVEGLSRAESVTAGEIVSQAIANSSMRWQIRTPGRAFFVVADSWFPGWHATVDGRPAEIYPTDGFLRGVMIDGAGDHAVEMTFTPPGFAIGLAGTGIGLALLAFIAFRPASGRLSHMKNEGMKDA